MKTTSYMRNTSDFDSLVESKVNEVILCSTLLSRFGNMSLKDLETYCEKFKEAGVRVVIDWDILMTQETFERTLSEVKKLDLSNVDAIRAQDPGALDYLRKNNDLPKIQLILETGNHNLIGIKKWIELIGQRLDRVILSIELSKDKIASYIPELHKLNVEVELLGLGRILLFYTPRKLVTPLYDDMEESTKRVHERPIEIEGSSEESPHKGFPIVENLHGTFMFNTKDHFLLENLAELEQMKLDYLRIDLRFHEDLNLLSPIHSLVQSSAECTKEEASRIKAEYGRTVIRGFYQVNKSDVLFKKLKNNRIQRKDENYLGDVLDVNKKHHIAILLRSKNLSLSKSNEIKFMTPDGKEKLLTVDSIRNSSGEEVDSGKAGDIVFVRHITGISVKSAVYLL